MFLPSAAILLGISAHTIDKASSTAIAKKIHSVFRNYE